MVSVFPVCLIESQNLHDPTVSSGDTGDIRILQFDGPKLLVY